MYVLIEDGARAEIDSNAIVLLHPESKRLRWWIANSTTVGYRTTTGNLVKREELRVRNEVI